MLTYRSLFDEVTTEDLKKQYEYKGTVSDILEDLKHKLEPSQLIFHPARLIKGLIDYKIQYPQKVVVNDIIRYVIEFAKEIYSIRAVQLFKVTSLKLMLMQNNLSDFLTFEVTQEKDPAACLSLVGKLSQQTADQIFSSTNGTDILLIPMAHGATPAGIDILLRYSILTQSNTSMVYPCRFSVHKQKDPRPHLSPYEISYLIRESRARTIVVFEENVVTGETLKAATHYLQETVFSKPVISVTNLDISKEASPKESAKGNHEEMIKQFLLAYK